MAKSEPRAELEESIAYPVVGSLTKTLTRVVAVLLCNGQDQEVFEGVVPDGMSVSHHITSRQLTHVNHTHTLTTTS